jgi:transposase
MTTTTTTTEKPEIFKVQVNSWEFLRKVRIMPDQVALQVTVPTCSHCPTCQRRVRDFSALLGLKPQVLHQWKYLEDGANWLFLPKTEEQNGLDLLREVLEIQVFG